MIADIQCLPYVSNPKIWQRVFENSEDNSFNVTTSKNRLQWMGCVLQMLFQRILHRALFADTGTSWKKQRGG